MNSKTLFNIMNRKVDSVPFRLSSGVYEIPFELIGCTDSSYVEMTKCHFFERLKEYKNDFKYIELSTTLSRTFFKRNISLIDFDNTKILSKEVH